MAEVRVEGEVKGTINKGFLVLLGVEAADVPEDVDWLQGKIANLRVFNDEQGLMNLSLQEVGGAVLLISQFTLHAAVKKGNRPSFIRAARPDHARPLYEALGKALEAQGIKVAYGVFGADMKAALVNDGPVTIWMDSKNKE